MLRKSSLSCSGSVRTKILSTICCLSNLTSFSIILCPLPGSCYAEWSLDALCVKRLHYHGSVEYEQPETVRETDQPGLLEHASAASGTAQTPLKAIPNPLDAGRPAQPDTKRSASAHDYS